jgi:hypothetical protein
MRLLNAPKVFFRGFKTVYEKVAAPKKSREEPEVPSIFDSGMSVLGDWILDLAVLALIAVVIGTVLKWAYIAVFHK